MSSNLRSVWAVSLGWLIVLGVFAQIMAASTEVPVTIDDSQLSVVAAMCDELGKRVDATAGTYTLSMCFRKIVTDLGRVTALHQDGHRNPPPKDEDGSVVHPRCGDGTINTDRSEQCDDGNNIPGDGCDPRCQTENTR